MASEASGAEIEYHWDYDLTGDPVPKVGELSIILDGAGNPRAPIETATVDIVPLDKVIEEHAFSEGEGDRTLATWREIHERYWREHSDSPRGFEWVMPVVCVWTLLQTGQLRGSATYRLGMADHTGDRPKWHMNPLTLRCVSMTRAVRCNRIVFT